MTNPVSPGFPFDSLAVVCGVSESCAISSTGATIRELSLALASIQDVIPGGRMMDAPDTWNPFEGRQLLLFLRDSTDTRRISILATVSPMRAVPEPSWVLVASCLGVSMALFRRLRRK
jgi:hypothetical protein